jgi:hypothetical protein
MLNTPGGGVDLILDRLRARQPFKFYRGSSGGSLGRICHRICPVWPNSTLLKDLCKAENGPAVHSELFKRSEFERYLLPKSLTQAEDGT